MVIVNGREDVIKNTIIRVEVGVASLVRKMVESFLRWIELVMNTYTHPKDEEENRQDGEHSRI